MFRLWARRATLVFLATLVTLTGLEVAFRFVVPEPSQQQLYAPSADPLLGVELPASVSFEFTGLGTRIPPTTVTTDAFGFRISPTLRGPAGRRLVCIGDSNTFGWGVEWADSFCTGLAARLGADWEAINLGVPGYNALQAVRRLELRGLPLRPELVVFFFGSNDYDPPLEHGAPDATVGWLAEHSALARWVLYRLKRAEGAETASEAPSGDLNETPFEGAEEDGASRSGPGDPNEQGRADAEEVSPPAAGEGMVLHALDRLAVAARSGSFHAVTFFNTSGQGLQGLLERLDQQGLYYDVFDDTFGGQELKIPGDGHYNASGHAAIAERMHRFLRSRGLHDGSGPAAPHGAEAAEWETLYHPFVGYPEPLSTATTSPPGDAATEMVRFAAGSAVLGDDSLPASRPRHSVQLNAFAIDATEVTVRAFNEFAEAERRPTVSGQAGAPVTGIDWHEARAYCRWADKRLPTAAEWERAARGKGGRRYAFGERFDPSQSHTVHRLSGPLRTQADWEAFLEAFQGPDPAPISAAGPSADRTPEGVLHLHGNVAEWVSGEVAPWPGGRLRDLRAFGRPGLRWVKGVGITSRDYAAPAAARWAYPATHRDIGLGFRCARSQPAPSVSEPSR